MDSYKKLVKKIIDDGERKQNRTGIDTISITGYMFEHDMSEGFPLLTSKKMAYKSIFSELEFFIKGYHNKDWLKEHKNHIWDEWCSPILQPYGNDEKTKEKMKSISELGPIYGVQWRNFDGKQYFDENLNEMYSDEFSKGVDQLKYVVDEIKNNPTSRRIICSAWNPNQMSAMALPPCHCFMQFYVNDGKLSCQLYQRSADVFLGVPFNIASYSLFTMMIAQVCGLKYGTFVHTIGDAHIYLNHLEQINTQLSREPRALPTMKINPNVKSIYDFKYEDFELENYNPHKGIKGKVAV